jgi:hypothetical protein
MTRLLACVLAAPLLCGAADPKCAEAQALIAKFFAPHAQLLASHKPCLLKGDFNGDGVEDAAALVRLNSDRAALPLAVKVVNPWSSHPGRLPSKTHLAIAVVFGAAAPSARFLAGDRELLSTPIWQDPAATNLLAVIKRREASKRAKGDAIGVATEAGIEVKLYWDGATFRVEAPREEP